MEREGGRVAGLCTLEVREAFGMGLWKTIR